MAPVTAARGQSEQKKEGEAENTGLQENGRWPRALIRPAPGAGLRLPAGPAAGVSAPASAAGAGADDACLFSSSLLFPPPSLNAKQINPPLSAESFPLVVENLINIVQLEIILPPIAANHCSAATRKRRRGCLEKLWPLRAARYSVHQPG